MKRSDKCPPCCNQCAWGKADFDKPAPVPAKKLDIVMTQQYDTSCGPGSLGRLANGAVVRLERVGNALFARQQVRPGGLGLSLGAMA